MYSNIYTNIINMLKECHMLMSDQEEFCPLVDETAIIDDNVVTYHTTDAAQKGGDSKGAMCHYYNIC